MLQILEAEVLCYKEGLGLSKYYKLTSVKEDILVDIGPAAGPAAGSQDDPQEAILTRLFKERYFKDKGNV